MKKIYLVLVLIIIITNLLFGCNINKESYINNLDENSKYNEEVLNYDEIKDSLIRFHVIANSDTHSDQQLKLKVRDAVLNYLYPYMSKSKSLSETRSIINDNLKNVEEIAIKVIKDNNYNYSVEVFLKRINFPEKEYGNLVLPQGNYEAFEIVIGSGQGHNWWCVMFPPLCFVDESYAVVEYDKTKKSIESSKKQKEENEKKEDDNKIEYKFKIVEIFNDLS